MQQFVLEKMTKAAKRWGYCDFMEQADFDPATEEVVESDQELDSDYEWAWDGKTFVQGELIDRTASGLLLKDIVTGTHYIVEVASGALGVRQA